MSGTVVLVLIAIIAATYVSALLTALRLVSRSALEERLAESDRVERGAALFAHLDTTVLALALVRTALRMVVFGLLLVELVGLDADARMTVGHLLAAGGISIAVLWISTSVISLALSRHATLALVSGALSLLRGVDILCSPLTRGLAFIDEAVRRLSGANLREAADEREAELLRSIGDTHREGGLDDRAAALLENVVEFSSTDVGEVMTPRTDIDGVELTDDLSAIRALIVEVGHSRIPVYEGSLDHIVGVLYVKDLVRYLGEDVSDFKLRPILRQPIVVPETKPVRELLADFQRSEVHMAVVIDEYGGTAGLVTIEDVLEEIVGEIHDEHDAAEVEEPALNALNDHSAEVDGRFHIDDLNERMRLELPEDEEFDTVAGYVLWSLGHVPEPGEVFEAHAARFTVLSASSTHVQRVKVELLEQVGAD